ncbi:hypothetical protein OKW46_000030 [Paraburkholderia sp. WSM4179]|nr:hypothetical protein [Paraburkholderia sp. WSM4179]
MASHAGGQFPELMPYGRMFKLNGYTFGERTIPVAVMAMLDVTRTRLDHDASGNIVSPKDGLPIFDSAKDHRRPISPRGIRGLSASTCPSRRKPAWKHRDQDVVFKEGMMKNSRECVQPRKPHNGVAEPRVQRCEG